MKRDECISADSLPVVRPASGIGLRITLRRRHDDESREDPYRSDMSLLRWAQRAASTIGGRDEKLEIMARTPTFSRCGWRELTELGSIFEISFVHPGELLQRRGTRCECWTIVAEGTALAFDGDDPVGLPQWWVSLVDAGGSWDEDSIVRGEPCRVSITALTPMTLLVVDSRDYGWLVERFESLSGRYGEASQPLSLPLTPPLGRRAGSQSWDASSAESGPVRASRS